MSEGLLLLAFTICVLLALISRELTRLAVSSDAGHTLRRWLCSRIGHEPLADERGRPVTAFHVCRRCGKIGGRLE